MGIKIRAVNLILCWSLIVISSVFAQESNKAIIEKGINGMKYPNEIDDEDIAAAKKVVENPKHVEYYQKQGKSYVVTAQEIDENESKKFSFTRSEIKIEP